MSSLLTSSFLLSYLRTIHKFVSIRHAPKAHGPYAEVLKRRKDWTGLELEADSDLQTLFFRNNVEPEHDGLRSQHHGLSVPL